MSDATLVVDGRVVADVAVELAFLSFSKVWLYAALSGGARPEREILEESALLGVVEEDVLRLAAAQMGVQFGITEFAERPELHWLLPPKPERIPGGVEDQLDAACEEMGFGFKNDGERQTSAVRENLRAVKVAVRNLFLPARGNDAIRRTS